jgi:hypothetical protein
MLTTQPPTVAELRDDLRRYLAGEFALGKPWRLRERAIPHAEVANALRDLGYRSRRIPDLRNAEDHLTVLDVCLRLNIGKTALYRRRRAGPNQPQTISNGRTGTEGVFFVPAHTAR